MLALLSLSVGPLALPRPQLPASRRPFADGVQIDWAARTVYAESHVVLRTGPLEFFACFAGKEHESILRFDASAANIYMALGLIGVTPGHPPRWNAARAAYDDPSGDLVEISVTPMEGIPQTVPAADWLYEVEYARTPHARPWIFAGSLIEQGGTVSADQTGVGVALVDFPDSLISYSRRFPSRYGELWARVNTARVPPMGTRVQVILRPATARDLDVRLDAQGAAHLNGRYCDLDDLVDVLRLNWQLDRARVQVIAAGTALRSDIRAVRRRLRAAGLPAEAVRFELDQSASSSADSASR